MVCQVNQYLKKVDTGPELEYRGVELREFVERVEIHLH
jgi:hypothetical protein